MDEDTNVLVLTILDFLKTEYHKSTTTSDAKESIEVAMQCLETAFNTNLSEQQCKVKTGLREIFRSYNLNTASMFGSQNPFAQFLGGMGQQAADTSTAAPTARAQPGTSDLEVGAPYELPAEATPDQKARADEQKSAGNDNMKNNDFPGALNSYTEAIKLDGRNAVYFCNRAAAYQKLNQLDKALRDCQIALQLQPDYARAFGRMGVTYSTLGNYQKASACYRKALELEPTNESYANNLKISEEILAAGPGDRGGFPGGGPPVSLQSLFNNPSLINMATQMLQDPNMQNMMRSIMSEHQSPNAGAGDQMNMNGLLQVGEAMANQIRMANPNLVEELTSRLNQATGGAQPPPGNQPPGPPSGPSEN